MMRAPRTSDFYCTHCRREVATSKKNRLECEHCGTTTFARRGGLRPLVFTADDIALLRENGIGVDTLPEFPSW